MSTDNATPGAPIYDRLAKTFDSHKTLPTGMTYITGEQAISRLNEVLGVDGWGFQIIEHGINAEADECWVLGELHARIDGVSVARQQFGSQKINRAKATGAILDFGFNLKGAATDAIKKCASLYGVGLYLFNTEERQAAVGATSQAPQASSSQAPQAQRQGSSPLLACEECGEPLAEQRFKSGDTWTPQALADTGRRKYGRVLCFHHYMEAKKAAPQQAPAPAQARRSAPSEDLPF